MGQGRQAKILSLRQEKAILRYLADVRHPKRAKALFLLSIKGGLRAKEISRLTWSMVCDGDGVVSDSIELTDSASKGKGGRSIPLNNDLRAALEELRMVSSGHGPVISSERGGHMTANSVAVWFARHYQEAGLEGCSSHSGRRTFITRAARKVTEAGGSLRDVQQLAGHSNLATTQVYIEGSADAKRKLVNMV